jgi:hypothetical protein
MEKNKTNTRDSLQTVFRAENLMSQNEVVQHAKTGSSTAKLAWCKQAHQQHWVEGILIHSIRASKLTKQLPCRPYDQLQVQHVRMKYLLPSVSKVPIQNYVLHFA